MGGVTFKGSIWTSPGRRFVSSGDITPTSPVFYQHDSCWRAIFAEWRLDCKEIQPIHPKGNQSWIFIGRTAAEAETPILWPPDLKKWLIWKDPDAGKDWRQEEKGMTEDGMAGWHHQLDGYEFEQAPGVVYGVEDWYAAVHSVSKRRTWLSNWIELTESKSRYVFEI